MKYALQQADNMVLGQLFTNQVLDPRILQVMLNTSRDIFVPERLRGAAHADEDLDIGGGRAMLAPLTLAKLIKLANIQPTERVLTIGVLTGYSAAVLAPLASHVVATEIDENCLEQARANIARLGYGNVNLQLVKSLADGYAASAPYDVIVLQGAVQRLPEQLTSQLAKGGRLVGMRSVAGRVDAKAGLSRGFMMWRIHNQYYSRDHFDTGATLLPGFSAESNRFTF